MVKYFFISVGNYRSHFASSYSITKLH